DRCVKVVGWEEKQNIRKKDKREARDKNPKLKKNTSLNSKDKKKIKIAKRDEALAKEIKLQKTWNNTILNWIQKGVNPF
ncbi:37113_t:CDS:1, partial [Gigaspora margarita]